MGAAVFARLRFNVYDTLRGFLEQSVCQGTRGRNPELHEGQQSPDRAEHHGFGAKYDETVKESALLNVSSQTLGREGGSGNRIETRQFGYPEAPHDTHMEHTLMPEVRVTRRVHWNSAHRLYRPDWSDDRNSEVFGACSNPHWHGHNYEMDVTVTGEIDPATGYVLDLKVLKDLVEDRVLSDLDHRNLNIEVDWLAGQNPTTENLVVAIWERLADHLPENVRLDRLVLWETPRNFVEYTGPSGAAGGAS